MAGGSASGRKYESAKTDHQPDAVNEEQDDRKRQSNLPRPLIQHPPEGQHGARQDEPSTDQGRVQPVFRHVDTPSPLEPALERPVGVPAGVARGGGVADALSEVEAAEDGGIGDVVAGSESLRERDEDGCRKRRSVPALASGEGGATHCRSTFCTVRRERSVFGRYTRKSGRTR